MDVHSGPSWPARASRPRTAIWTWRRALARDARIDAEAINGDLRFILRGTVDAEFDIETFNGEIDNCFGPKPRRTREYGPGNELNFKRRRRATRRVRIKTLNGGVEVCKRT